MKRHRIWGVAMGMVAALLIADMATARPLTHERAVSGDYALTLGWLDKPAIAGLKNAALVEVAAAKDNQPVDGAEGALTAQIVYEIRWYDQRAPDRREQGHRRRGHG